MRLGPAALTPVNLRKMHSSEKTIYSAKWWHRPRHTNSKNTRIYYEYLIEDLVPSLKEVSNTRKNTLRRGYFRLAQDIFWGVGVLTLFSILCSHWCPGVIFSCDEDEVMVCPLVQCGFVTACRWQFVRVRMQDIGHVPNLNITWTQSYVSPPPPLTSSSSPGGGEGALPSHPLPHHWLFTPLRPASIYMLTGTGTAIVLKVQIQIPPKHEACVKLLRANCASKKVPSFLLISFIYQNK